MHNLYMRNQCVIYVYCLKVFATAKEEDQMKRLKAPLAEGSLECWKCWKCCPDLGTKDWSGHNRQKLCHNPWIVLGVCLRISTRTFMRNWQCSLEVWGFST